MSPSYTDQMKKKIEDIVGRYPDRRAALLPVLHLTQNEFGHIGPAEEEMVAAALDVKPIEVHEVVTFYTMYNRKAVGTYHIQVCSNLSCSLLGSEKLVDHLTRKLGIKPGETTADGRFTLSTVECLGACEEAPSMMINFDYHGRLDENKIEKILDGLK